MGKTLYDKLWDSHVIHVEADGTTLLYVDRQLLHEITSAQASGAGRQARVGSRDRHRSSRTGPTPA
jgi:homoaconitase/3-isopropylmalate dehydratase large subunit